MSRNIDPLSVVTDGSLQYYAPHLMYQYAYVNTTPRAPLTANDYNLVIRQQPKEALVALEGKEKQRKPVDPPPIVQVQVRNSSDPRQQFLQSPYLFMCVSLWFASKAEPQATDACQSLAGSLVSSLHRLKDIDNNDGGFFVFGDISVKMPGEHRLSFSLFELRKRGSNSEKDTGEVIYLKSIISEPFRVLQPKDFKGLDESTYLSRAFSDQGVRLRLRKEPRGLLGSKRSFMYTGQQPIPPPPPPLDSAVPSTPIHHIPAHYESHPYSEETSPSGNSAVKRIRQSVELGNVNRGDERSPTYYDQPSPIITGNGGYHSRHHSLYSSGTPCSQPVRTPSFTNFAHALNHNVPSSASSYYSPITQSVQPRPFPIRQSQHQQRQQFLNLRPSTPSATSVATSSYMIDALAAAATSQIPTERYTESTPSTLASPIYDRAYNDAHDGDMQSGMQSNIQVTDTSAASVTAVTASSIAAAYASPLPPPHPPVPQSQHSQQSQQSQHSQHSQHSSFSGHSHQSHFSPSVAEVQYGMEGLNPHGNETNGMARDVRQLQMCMGET